MSRISGDTSLEFGSFFHLPHGLQNRQRSLHVHGQLFGSGRDALLAAVQEGAQVHGWKKVLLPSYYCAEIARRIGVFIDVGQYPDTPVSSAFRISTQPDEVIVAIEYFGTRAHPEVDAGMFIIDRTHAPLVTHEYPRKPKYIFGSLRKVLPLADGGFLSAETDHLPRPVELPNQTHLLAASLMQRAMEIKGEYLRGSRVDKREFLELYRRGESLLGSEGPAAMTDQSKLTLASFDEVAAQAKTRRNVTRLRRLLGPLPSIVSYAPAASHLVLVADSEDTCNAICSALIARGVFPARLWPIEASMAEFAERDLSTRLMVIHADYRYPLSSMRVLAQRIRESLDI